MHILQHFPDSYDPELHLLTRGPQSHIVHAGYFVNGVKFVTSERDKGHITQNNGVMVEGLGFNNYEVLVSVIELIYGKGMSVVLFKCKWFNTDPTRRRSTILDRGLLSVDLNSVWYENEPFILATMMKQVFYLDDPLWSCDTTGPISPRPVVDPAIYPSLVIIDPSRAAPSELRHPLMAPETIHTSTQHQCCASASRNQSCATTSTRCSDLTAQTFS
ncbi:hypothetical protein ACLB2K_030989 [Fragaria x ananassa]